LAGLMAQLNHSSPKMAMRYSHLNVDHLREWTAVNLGPRPKRVFL
jgi:hypothetical protein